VVDVDAKHLSQREAQVLTVALGVALRAGVVHSDVEKPVRAELDSAALCTSVEQANWMIVRDGVPESCRKSLDASFSETRA
jgi:hypothetical protein